MYADFKLKFNLQFLPFKHFRYVYSSVLIQPLRSHRLDPARPMSMHGPLHGCSARPNLEAASKPRMISSSESIAPKKLSSPMEWKTSGTTIEAEVSVGQLNGTGMANRISKERKLGKSQVV